MNWYKKAKAELFDPLNPPKGDFVTAIKLKDGRIFYDHDSVVHGQLASQVHDTGVEWEDMDKAGFIENGHYIEEDFIN